MTENVFFKVPHFFSDIKSLTRLTILKKRKKSVPQKNAEKILTWLKSCITVKKCRNEADLFYLP